MGKWHWCANNETGLAEPRHTWGAGSTLNLYFGSQHPTLEEFYTPKNTFSCDGKDKAKCPWTGKRIPKGTKMYGNRELNFDLCEVCYVDPSCWKRRMVDRERERERQAEREAARKRRRQREAARMRERELQRQREAARKRERERQRQREAARKGHVFATAERFERERELMELRERELMEQR